MTIIEADGTPAPQPFFSVPVDQFRDRGLTAVVVDPKLSERLFHALATIDLRVSDSNTRDAREMLFKARRRDPAVVFASDPQFAGKDLRKLPLLQRKNLLQEALQSAPANARIRPVQWIGEEGTRCTTLPAR